MLYSQLSPEQQRRILDDPAHYPLHVSFLGKAALLSFQEVAFLRRQGIDFEVHDEQVEELLEEEEGSR
jgi:hypothetical protein